MKGKPLSRFGEAVVVTAAAVVLAVVVGFAITHIHYGCVDWFFANSCGVTVTR